MVFHFWCALPRTACSRLFQKSSSFHPKVRLCSERNIRSGIVPNYIFAFKFDLNHDRFNHRWFSFSFFKKGHFRLRFDSSYARIFEPYDRMFLVNSSDLRIVFSSGGKEAWVLKRYSTIHSDWLIFQAFRGLHWVVWDKCLWIKIYILVVRMTLAVSMLVLCSPTFFSTFLVMAVVRFCIVDSSLVTSIVFSGCDLLRRSIVRNRLQLLPYSIKISSH